VADRAEIEKRLHACDPFEGGKGIADAALERLAAAHATQENCGPAVPPEVAAEGGDPAAANSGRRATLELAPLGAHDLPAPIETGHPASVEREPRE
jgi:hypothetical protein